MKLKKVIYHDEEIKKIISEINITEDYYNKFSREYLYQFLVLEPKMRDMLKRQFLIDNDL